MGQAILPVTIGNAALGGPAGIPSSGSLGSWIFDITAVVLAVLGVLEARAFRPP